ncbi:hypothetical protein NDU88_008186 [Pleurodeles waltl]|uniref:Uncharacterized protein n=1 Tax=Pleurodeles waltl TaxID=8319 RepID=A0AAV7NDH9_PLEWA|nr:hypothetical protein NDU88_008186 [Pleurodeles waltl]
MDTGAWRPRGLFVVQERRLAPRSDERSPGAEPACLRCPNPPQSCLQGSDLARSSQVRGSAVTRADRFLPRYLHVKTILAKVFFRF